MLKTFKQIGDVILDDDTTRGRLDVYYLKLGKHQRTDEILRRHYKRIAVEKSHPLVELHLGFDYLYHCVYVLQSHEEYIQLEKEKRDNIRKGHLSFINGYKC